jgi:hypothetical protein
LEVVYPTFFELGKKLNWNYLAIMHAWEIRMGEKGLWEKEEGDNFCELGKKKERAKSI